METERLELLIEGEAQSPYALPASGTLVIGSSAERARLVLTGQGVDAAHCAVGRAQSGGFAIKDLGSLSGTHVNGERVASARLKHGDRIQLGSRSLRVRDPARAESAPARLSTAAGGSAPGSISGAAPAGAAVGGGTGPPASGPAREDAQARVPLRILGGYQLVRPLGRGSMGEVYLAVQQSLQRQVALKLLSQELAANAEFVRRFQAEARAAAALSHPNVVVVYDVGMEAGRHYLSMEYMEGGSLEERVRGGARLPWREVLEALIDAARGLSFAEEKQLVHRDIKPANLMRSASGAIKIADLGLAASTHPEALATAGADGRKVYGTPHFIAPEQARGDPPDRRSDLYSLGATAYRLLAGRTAFQGDNARDILRQVFNDEPPPLAAFAPDCPPELAASVARLMHKQPAQRYGSARELLVELEALRLRGRAAQPARSTRRLWPAALLVLSLLAGGFYLWSRPASPPEPHDSSRVAQPLEPALDPDRHAVLDPGTPPLPVGPAGPAGSALSVPDLTAGTQGELELRELKAELALRDAPPASDPTRRAQALRELALQHPATRAATSAAQEAGELERSAALAAARERIQEQARASALEKLGARAAGAAPGSSPAAALETLHALREAQLLAEAAGSELLGEVRAELESKAWSVLSEGLKRALDEVEQACARGDWKAARERLAEISNLAEPPGYGPLPSPAALVEVQGLLARTAERALRLSADEQQWRDAHEGAELQVLSAALRGGPGAGSALGAQLRALDLGAAHARLAEAAAQLSGGPAQARAQLFLSDLERAQAALRSLIDTWTAGEWKRRSLSDPRPGRGGLREVSGVDVEGLSLAHDGTSERLSWSVFGERPEALSQLFLGRLTREWSAAEQAAIAALLRVSVAAHVAAKLEQVFSLSQAVRFGPSEAQQIAQSYAPAEDWARTPEARESIARERRAAELLARALQEISESAWSEAVLDLQQARERGQETWLLALLSSGAEPEPDPWTSASARALPIDPPPSLPAGPDLPASQPAAGTDGSATVKDKP